MPAAGERASTFEPPGPGAWTRDADRFPRPATRFVIELYPESARLGFVEATARYGVLLDHVRWAFVHRWAYLSPHPVEPLAELPAEPTRQAWEQLVASSAALRERLAASAGVFDDTRWRHDVRWWDEQAKPALRRGHDDLAAVEPDHLDTRELGAHLQTCRDHLRRAIDHRHRLNVAPVIPVGDFLVHAREWSGRPAAELLPLLRPVRRSPAADELDRLADALGADPQARDRVWADDAPASVLAFLRARAGPVGRAAADYLDVAGDCSLGSGLDVAEPRLAEAPHALLETVRAALRRVPSDDAGRPPGDGRAAEVRAAVPPRRRAAFDALLAEANASHRLRDERAVHGDVRAYGLARRAILAAGRRLADAGAVADPEHLVEAGYDELRALLAGRAGPSGEELAARARYRREADAAAVPEALGGPPRSPVPTEWLPAGAARTERAFRTYLQAMSEPADAASGPATVQGTGASVGTCTGRARVIDDAEELQRLEQGDVLVTGSTTPAFNVVLPIVGAVVTDRGGLLSHAAVVAREYAVPAVVGAGDATTTIPDGAIVTVDGERGTVTVHGPGVDATARR